MSADSLVTAEAVLSHRFVLDYPFEAARLFEAMPADDAATLIAKQSRRREAATGGESSIPIDDDFAGAFPVWLTPQQVSVIPITSDHNDYAERVKRELHAAGEVTDVVVSPIGFISDHLEVLFDLDTEAKDLCEELGLNMIRAATVGTHPRFVRMIRELICERISGEPKACLGQYGPNHDVCPEDCCLSGRPANPQHGGGRPQ